MIVSLGLIWTAAMIGLAGGVHCVAMCASPCTLAVPREAILAFQAGRLSGYAGLGGAAALGAAAFSEVATLAPWVRPIWLMTHVGILAVGGWMLATGRQPRMIQQALLAVSRCVPGARLATAAPTGSMPLTQHAPVARGLPRARGLAASPRRRAFVTGLAWSLLPCGLLYSVLMLAWMGGHVLNGVLIMATFALVSGAQLWLGQRGLLALLGTSRDRAAIRLAGAITVVGAGLLLWWAATGHAPPGFCLPR